MIGATSLLLPEAQNCSTLWGFSGARKGFPVTQWGTKLSTSRISHFPKLLYKSPQRTKRGSGTMARDKFVGYLRVSTEKKGQSGLGIEAQRKAIEDYLNGGRWELLAEYVEIESGKRSDHPELARAITHAKATGATLVIAKLDRLSRNVAFISNLMESGVEFVAADMAMANRLTVHVLAAVAEHEREMISQRTMAALAAAKARGIKLGNPNGARALRGLGNAHAVAAVKARADAHLRRVLPVIRAVRGEGTTSLHGMAAELNRRGILTARGGQWYATTVKNLLDRAAP
jgi:DNA invertase Pin-like site-specific DNA recombinase